MPFFPRLHDALVDRLILGFPFRRPIAFFGILAAIGAIVAGIIWYSSK